MSDYYWELRTIAGEHGSGAIRYYRGGEKPTKAEIDAALGANNCERYTLRRKTVPVSGIGHYDAWYTRGR